MVDYSSIFSGQQSGSKHCVLTAKDFKVKGAKHSSTLAAINSPHNHRYPADTSYVYLDKNN